jgi:hypothetical protein
MIPSSLSKFFFNLPKLEGAFYACQTAGPLTQRGEDAAGSDIYLDIVTTRQQFEAIGRAIACSDDRHDALNHKAGCYGCGHLRREP